jgi:gluconolactonase
MKQSVLSLSLFVLISVSVLSQTNKQQFQPKDFTDSVFTGSIEGPAFDKAGNLYVVNFARKGTIAIVDKKGKAKLFVDLPKGSTGNGIRFDKKGRMYVADYTGHNILAINTKTKKINVFAHDSSMNQPNDVAIMSNGILFASDPNWKNSTGNLWRADKNGKLTLLEENMGTTNGVEVAPGDSVLYVNESIQRKIWKYHLDASGNISQKTLFHTFPDFGMDGMRCDEKGNLYVTRHGKGTVAILSPDGKLLREVVMKGQKPSNIAFGGKQGKTCFITLQDRGLIEIFEAEEVGREFNLWQK